MICWIYVAVFCILFLYYSLFGNFSYAQSTSSDRIIGYIDTNKARYITGEPLHINGAVWKDEVSKTSDLPNATITLLVNSDENMIANRSIILHKSKDQSRSTFSYILNNTWNAGKYNISSYMNHIHFGQAKTEVITIYETPFFRLLMIGVFFSLS